MYIVKCGFCDGTFETESEGDLKCPHCGGQNAVENIIKKTSGNYFMQADEQTYVNEQNADGPVTPRSNVQRTKFANGIKTKAIILEIGLMILGFLVIMIINIMGGL